MPQRIAEVIPAYSIRFPETPVSLELTIPCQEILAVHFVMEEAGKFCEFNIISLEDGFEAELGETHGAGRTPWEAVVKLAGELAKCDNVVPTAAEMIRAGEQMMKESARRERDIPTPGQ